VYACVYRDVLFSDYLEIIYFHIASQLHALMAISLLAMRKERNVEYKTKLHEKV